MFPLFVISLALVSLPLFAQTPQADPPVASLPVPSAAVSGLQSRPEKIAPALPSDGSIVLSTPEEEKIIRVPLKPRPNKDAKTNFRNSSSTLFLVPLPSGP